MQDEQWQQNLTGALLSADLISYYNHHATPVFDLTTGTLGPKALQCSHNKDGRPSSQS